MEKYQSSLKYSYVLGISLIVEALKQKPQYVSEVYLSSKAYKNKELEILVNLCTLNNISIKEDDRIIEKLSLKENCYGIAKITKYKTKINKGNHLVLYGFDDFGQLGTIIRSAVSFDFKDIVLIDTKVDYFSPKTIRASMGSFFHTNIETYSTFEEYLSKYLNTLIPFTSDGTRELKSIKTKKPYALVIPCHPKDLDGMFMNTHYVKHRDENDISLTSSSAIVFNYFFHQNANDKNI